MKTTLGQLFPLSVKGPQDRIQRQIEACPVFQAVMALDSDTPTYAAGCDTCGHVHRTAVCPHANIDEYFGKCDDCGIEVRA